MTDSDRAQLLGLRVIESPHVPLERVPGPMALFRSKGHPLIYWLSRQLARVGVALEPDMLTPYRTWIDGPLKVIVMGDTILIHPAHHHQLRALIETINRGQNAR